MRYMSRRTFMQHQYTLNVLPYHLIEQLYVAASCPLLFSNRCHRLSILCI